MKQHAKGIIRSVVFLSILFSSLLYLNKVTRPKFDYSNSDWPTTSTYEQFYRMDRDSVDVLFLGSSVMVNAVSPQRIYEQYGIRSYNLGSENQSPVISYYWLKEALRFQSPKAVVMDCRFLFPVHTENPLNMIEGLVRKSIDPMKWSSVKAEAVHAVCSIDDGQDELSYYLTNLRYHERWKSLGRNDFDTSMQESPLKGYAPLYEDGPDEYDAYWPSNSAETAPFGEHMEDYLDRITALCKEHDIDLILIDLPGNNMNDGINNTLSKYAGRNDIMYLNYCETSLYATLGASLPEENVTAHANVKGAMKFSDAMGRILKEWFDVPSVKDEQYEKDMAVHDHILHTDTLLKETDFAEYLRLLNDAQYTVFVSVMEDAGNEMPAAVIDAWHALGMTVELTGMYERSYYAVISPEGTSEESGSGFLSHSGLIQNGRVPFTVESAGRASGSWSSVRIDGKEYSPMKSGINIVVYDNIYSKVIDAVSYDTLQQQMSR